jgi:hypothetical protein
MRKFWSVKQRTLNFGCQKFGVVIGVTASPNINALPTLGAEAAGWLRVLEIAAGWRRSSVVCKKWFRVTARNDP